MNNAGRPGRLPRGSARDRRFADALANSPEFTSVRTKGARESRTTRVTTTPYAVTAADHVLFVDTDAAAIEVDLPAGTSGRHLKIVNCGSSGNNVTVDPDGTEEVRGNGAGVAVTLADGLTADMHYEPTEGWW